jgi:hypothetical protein
VGDLIKMMIMPLFKASSLSLVNFNVLSFERTNFSNFRIIESITGRQREKSSFFFLFFSFFGMWRVFMDRRKLSNNFVTFFYLSFFLCVEKRQQAHPADKKR